MYAAMAATIVLPLPTSPSSKRFMGAEADKSEIIFKSLVLGGSQVKR